MVSDDKGTGAAGTRPVPANAAAAARTDGAGNTPADTRPGMPDNTRLGTLGNTPANTRPGLPGAAPVNMRRRRPVLRAIIVMLAVLLIVLPATVALFGWWLTGSEGGARLVSGQIERLLPAVKLRGVEGPLTGPLRVAEIAIDMPTRTILLYGVELDWNPRALVGRHLHIRRLHATHLDIQQKDVDSPPLQLPEHLRLPVTVAIDRLEIDRASFAAVELKNAAGSAGYDGSAYRLDVEKLAVKTAGANALNGDLEAKATLNASRPFALDAEIAADTKGTVADNAFGAGGTVKLGGSLEELKTEFDLKVRQDKATARALGVVTLKPFDPTPLVGASVKLQGIDLAALRPGLPHTRLDANIDLRSLDAGIVDIVNHVPGLYDKGGIPVRTLRARVDRRDGGFRFDQLVAALGGVLPAGTITGGGSFSQGALTLDITTKELNLQRIDGRVRATRLTGNAVIGHREGRQEFTVALSEPVQKDRLSVAGHALLADSVLTVDRAELKLGQSAIDISGRMAFNGTQAFAAQGRIRQFRLRDIGNFPKAPELTLNGDFAASGARLPKLTADLSFNIRDGLLAGHPLAGAGAVRLRADTLEVPNLDLVSGVNRVSMQGMLSERDSQLAFSISAPQIEKLGAGFRGSIEATGIARGTLAQPRIVADWKAAGLHLPGSVRIDASTGHAEVMVDRTKPYYIEQASVDATVRGLDSGGQRVGALEAKVQFAPRVDGPLRLQLDAKNIAGAGRQVDSLTLSVAGANDRHTIDIALAEPNQRLSARASGGVEDLFKSPRWKGTIQRFESAGTLVATMTGEAELAVSQQRIQLDRFRLNADGATIDIEQFLRDPEKIVSRGRIEKLDIEKVLKLSGATVPVETNLILDGEWNLTLANSWAGSIDLRRRDGDVTVNAGAPVTLGLRALRASVNAANGRVKLQILADGQQLGRVEVDADTAIPAGGARFSIASAAPVSGRALIDVPSIAWIGPLVSPTLAAAGQLKGDVALSGTFGNPAFNGKINGTGLRFTMADLGIDLRQGVLDSEFSGTRLLLQQLEFASANGGSVRVAGPIDLAGGRPSLQLALTATRYQLLTRSDRKLVVSGASRINVADRRLKVDGNFEVDSALFDIGRTGAPTLSDDVVIVGREKKSEGKMAVALDVRVKLGDGIQLTGRGLDAQLQGEIRLINNAGEPLNAQGTLNVARGTYTAYGQKLVIEEGLLRFTGPLNNPALLIRAMRRPDPNQATFGVDQVAAGVSVRGTVLVPRITLVSEPPVPDAEKLSWLVLGRGLGSAGTGDLDALQRAAGMLLTNSAANGVSSQIATAFGLDTLSVGTSRDNVQQRIVTLGKKISSRLYVSYQKGLETASNALLLRYTLTPRLTLEAETGTRSVLSLFYNIAFDPK